MLLAVDIGNTNIHFGMHDGDRWCCSWRARTIHEKMSDEYAVLLRSFFQERGFEFAEINSVVMASVVPPLTSTFTDMFRRYLKTEPLNIKDEGVKLGVVIDIDHPHQVGADRIANAAAAHTCYGDPAIVVDFGTSTNFDIVDEQGHYIGGIIATGIGLSHDALVSQAAQLQKIDLAPPPSVVGRNTIHAMQSGIFLGYVSMIEGLISRIRSEQAWPTAPVIATGGLAPVIAKHTDVLEHISNHLTLDGLHIIWELNQT